MMSLLEAGAADYSVECSGDVVVRVGQTPELITKRCTTDYVQRLHKAQMPRIHGHTDNRHARTHAHTHTHTRLTALFWDYPGKLAPER